MSEPEHTPTPWKCKRSAHQQEWSHFIETENGRLIGAVATQNEPKQADANVALWLAAPALLAVCEAAYHYLRIGQYSGTQQDRATLKYEADVALRAALAAAKGKPE